MDRNELLKAIPTRQLLKRFKGAIGGNVTLRRMTVGNVEVSHEYSNEEVRDELAKRPHVPNKNESRGLRLMKIRGGK